MIVDIRISFEQHTLIHVSLREYVELLLFTCQEENIPVVSRINISISLIYIIIYIYLI